MHESEVKSRIKNLRLHMIRSGYNGYILPSTDEYLNEFVPAQNKRLEWLSGFTGSNGLLFLINNESIFFTDGRYTSQAKKELGKEIKVLDISITNIFKWIKLNIRNKNFKLLIDSKINSFSFIEKLKKIGKETNNKIFIKTNNFVDKFWLNRPLPKKKSIYFIPNKFSGFSYKSKIRKIKSKVNDFDFLFITSPESIAWLLNIRGRDLDYTPIVFCRLLIDQNSNLRLFIDKDKIPKKEMQVLEKKMHIKVFNEEELEDLVKKVIENKVIFLEKNCSYFFYSLLRREKAKIFFKEDPCQLEKAIKNYSEIKASINCHKEDGLALVKFFYWIDKQNFKKDIFDEIDAVNKLEKFRKQSKSFISPSFPTISAIGKNASVIHYTPTESKKAKFKEGELFLCDSGAQYIFGTTDVTRTILIGNKSKNIKEYKDYYTRVLIGNINLSILKFPVNTNGAHIDSIARVSLWSRGKDYMHGTGHGVGSFLSVHEGPQSISKSLTNVPLKPGMILSIEPGYYKENKFGIRLENLALIKNSKLKNFLEFEILTLFPFQRKLIDIDMLNYEQRKWINDYHKKVYEKLSICLDSNTKKWLKKHTISIPF